MGEGAPNQQITAFELKEDTIVPKFGIQQLRSSENWLKPKLRNSIANFTEWCKQNRNVRLKVLFPQLNRKLRGYYNYYGVKGNAVGLKEFHSRAMEILLKWLNRRSQRRSFNWQGFKDLLDHFQVPRPRITDQPRVQTSAGVWQRVNTLPSASRA